MNSDSFILFDPPLFYRSRPPLKSSSSLLLVLALRIHGNFPGDEGDGQKEKRQKDLTQEMERGWMGGDVIFLFQKPVLFTSESSFFKIKIKKKGCPRRACVSLSHLISARVVEAPFLLFFSPFFPPHPTHRASI